MRDRREIRLALVLNGGVSLAIWIGGVVAEIDRARRAGMSQDADLDEVESIYRTLLDLTDSVLRTDVISGASAGGLNGCLLATAVANHGTVADVRNTWVDLGSFREMLRSGLDPEPPSVLKGDDYFLPALVREFVARSNPGAVRTRLALAGTERAAIGPAERVRLLVTGTDLGGEPHVHMDDFGGNLHDREHRALFVVEHDLERGRSAFARDDVPRRLARIARSTASFPGAFEASFVRVTDPPSADDAGEGKERDPNLHGIATMTSSRWVADGGVLDNAPFRPALAAIAKARARGPVRRVLCYVTPYGAPPEQPEAERTDAPTFGKVVGAAFELPRSLTMTETLQQLAEYRDRVGARRAGRMTMTARLGDTLVPHARLVFDLYCTQRSLSSVNDVLERLSGTPRFPAGEWARTRTRPPVSAALLLATGIRLPWVPETPDTVPTTEADFAARLADEAWPWGLAPILRSARLVLDLLSRTLAITPPVPEGSDLDAARTNVFEAREKLSTTIAWVEAASERFLEAAAVRFDPQRRYSDEELVELNGGIPLDLGRVDADARRQLTLLLLACGAYRELLKADECRNYMRAVVKALGQGAPEAVVLLGRSELAPVRRRQLKDELGALLYGPTSTGEERQARLLATEVAYEALAPSREHDQRIDLLRINAEARCVLDKRELPEEKLTGLGLAHFAAFYKRSWRANDWMWGRLDGARRLADLLVDPTLLRLRLDALPPEVLEADIEGTRDVLVSIGAPPGLAGEYLSARFEREWAGKMPEVIHAELTKLAAWNLDHTPPPLEACRDAVAARLQLLVAAAELPVVRSTAIEDATEEGASPDAAGAVWAARNPVESFSEPEKLVGALRSLRLAQDESFADEVGSNLLTRNIATTAAVAASALSAKRSGLPGPARFVARSLRGLLLAFYGLAWSLTSRRPGAKLAGIALLLGAIAIVLWGLASDVDVREGGEGGGPPGWLSAFAKAAVAAALLLGVLRSGKAGLIVAGAFAVVYCSLVLTPWPDSWRDGFERFWETSSVATLLVVLAALGALAGFIVGRWPWRRRPRLPS
jgi:patatin-related protein